MLFETQWSFNRGYVFKKYDGRNLIAWYFPVTTQSRKPQTHILIKCTSQVSPAIERYEYKSPVSQIHCDGLPFYEAISDT